MAGLGRRSHYRKHLTDSVLHDFPEPKYPFERVAQILGSRGGNFFDLLVSPAIPLPTLTSAVKSIDNNTKTNTSSDGVVDSGSSSSGPVSATEMVPKLAILPTKFRKLVWVKRGDYVIVNCGNDDDDDNDDADVKDEERNRIVDTATTTSTYTTKGEEKGGIRYIIQHVLYKDQVKHLKDAGLWPSVFSRNDNLDDQNINNSALVKKDTAITNLKTSAQQSSSILENDGEAQDEDDLNYSQHDYLNEDDLMLTSNVNRIATLVVDDSSDESSSDEE